MLFAAPEQLSEARMTASSFAMTSPPSWAVSSRYLEYLSIGSVVTGAEDVGATVVVDESAVEDAFPFEEDEQPLAITSELPKKIRPANRKDLRGYFIPPPTC